MTKEAEVAISSESTMEHYKVVSKIDMRKVVELTVVAITPKYRNIRIWVIPERQIWNGGGMIMANAISPFLSIGIDAKKCGSCP